MQFAVTKGKLLHQGKLIYKKDEFSLEFLPRQIVNCSLLIHDINLGFIEYSDNIKCASQVSGYHPSPTIWMRKQLCIPKTFTGSLILFDNDIEDGDIVRLKETSDWETYYDEQSGWICIGDNAFNEKDISVEFATNCVVVLRNRFLKALWVKPVLI